MDRILTTTPYVEQNGILSFTEELQRFLIPGQLCNFQSIEEKKSTFTNASEL